ncbi:U5 small nuclear ribonucleoprotein TSSC4 [Odontesthes bonariensis]|uniref:U5 small nuclear ribonucleoprotein TSSC4 n=1 Tax=Odontesthes bonariensis TaxID=219752 RepID=UPI003F58985F
MLKMSDQRRIRDHGEVLNSDDVDELSASDESEPEEQPSRAPFDPELDHSDDDDDDGEAELCAPAAPTAQSSFILSGGSSAFSHRSHGIFGCLDSVERQPVSCLKQGSATESQKRSHPPSTCPTPPKKRGVPDYLVHPERWTHYSLEDVPESSDQDNRREAHRFLSSLQKERKHESSCDIQHRVVFSRPKKVLKGQLAEQMSPDQQGKEKGLHLSHLAEQEEEGREREKAGGRTEQFVEETDEEETEEENCMSGAVGPAEKKMIEDPSLGFTSLRKAKRKNYRKGSGGEDD